MTFRKERDPVWQAAIDSLPDAGPNSYGYAEIVNILQDTPLTYRPALLAEMIRIASPAFRMPDGMAAFCAKAIAMTCDGMRIVGPTAKGESE